MAAGRGVLPAEGRGADLSVHTGFTAANRRRFWQFVPQLYADDPRWVAPIWLQRTVEFSATERYLTHGAREFFVVSRGSRPIARAVAWWDAASAARFAEPTGFVSHFESSADPDGARLVLEAAGDWLRRRGARRVIGPASPRIGDSRGLLVDGDGPPPFGLPHTPPYYLDLFLHAGYEPAVDLLDWIVPLAPQYPRLERVAAWAERRFPGLTIRHMNMRRLRDELALIVDVYNEAWQRNWGYVPIDLDEFYELAKPMAWLYDGDYTIIIEHNGRCVAFQMLMPDLNGALLCLRSRTRPSGWWRFLRQLRRIRQFRALFIGVRSAYQKAGLEAVMMRDAVHQLAHLRGVTTLHVAWTLESNFWLAHQLKTVTGLDLRCNRYRLYSARLD